MACFVVPAVEAVVVTASYFAVRKKEMKLSYQSENANVPANETKAKFSEKLNLLMTMLWGGVFLLVIDHIWNGELVPFPPFFAAMSDPKDFAQMLYEIKTLGVLMSVSITALWGVICLVKDTLKKIHPAVKKSNID